ncbi:hypothetical protein [Trichloromonas sp.]|uniref:hypothetical protein n=1 Tax=Trichloromonas sp. TaxID=3069249 RepID=UPI002A3F5F19|nr:hypothetical protein [Trichloromonas sp.]
MFFIPLSQVESVELVIHALRAAGGEADCTACPAYRVCMKQCLTIANAVSEMVRNGSLPTSDGDGSPAPSSPGGTGAGKPARGGLKVVK